ncbi:hypothetical protein FKM82_021649 [Ascaphus truei]
MPSLFPKLVGSLCVPGWRPTPAASLQFLCMAERPRCTFCRYHRRKSGNMRVGERPDVTRQARLNPRSAGEGGNRRQNRLKHSYL